MEQGKKDVIPVKFLWNGAVRIVLAVASYLEQNQEVQRLENN